VKKSSQTEADKIAKRITLEDVRQNKAVQTYIRHADMTLRAIGYTEHAAAHVGSVAHSAAYILAALGRDEREQELARIAGYLHDIGNVINRADHAQSGALMAFRILEEMGMDPAEIAVIITAIGNHDEGTAEPVNDLTAALILADKSDVRRSRVRNRDMAAFDIHDRVNYAVEDAALSVDPQVGTATLQLTIDTEICAVMDYFEIFLERMLLCRKAAVQLGLTFVLTINGSRML